MYYFLQQHLITCYLINLLTPEMGRATRSALLPQAGATNDFAQQHFFAGGASRESGSGRKIFPLAPYA
jgi:hypothetical protein